jgi:hypothetical protein
MHRPGRGVGYRNLAMLTVTAARNPVVPLVSGQRVLTRPILTGARYPLPVGVCAVSRRVAWEFDWFGMVVPGKKTSTKEALVPRPSGWKVPR